MGAGATVSAFEKLRGALEGETVGRLDEIDALLVALVGRGHLFFVAEPGTAKTMMVDQLIARIAGARRFVISLTTATEEQAVLGPVSVPAYRHGRLERETAGFLPEADVVFLDEIWKASKALTDALLPLMRERRVRIGAEMVKVPMSSLIAASNEVPDLSYFTPAIWDRFDLRLAVQPLLDRDDLRAMLRLRVDPNPDPLIGWDAVLTAQVEATGLPVSGDAVEAIIEVAHRARRLGVPVSISGRRLNRVQDMARAVAWLAGDDTVQPHHLVVMRHMLWNRPEDRRTVRNTVFEVCATVEMAVAANADMAADLAERYDEECNVERSDGAHNQAVVEIARKVERAMIEAVMLEDRVSGRAAVTVADTIRRLERLYSTIAHDQARVDTGSGLADRTRREVRR